MFVGDPRWDNTPKMRGAVITDLPNDHLDFSSINYGYETPVFHRLDPANALLVALHLKLLERFFVFLIGGCDSQQFYSEGQQLESQYLRIGISLRPWTLKDNVIESFGGEVNFGTQRGRDDPPDGAVKLLCVFA